MEPFDTLKKTGCGLLAGVTLAGGSSADLAERLLSQATQVRKEDVLSEEHTHNEIGIPKRYEVKDGIVAAITSGQQMVLDDEGAPPLQMHQNGWNQGWWRWNQGGVSFHSEFE